jgi:hypothetical protein
MLPIPDHLPPVRRLLQSEVDGDVITTDIDAGTASSTSGRVWTQSADETVELLHARAVTVSQINHELARCSSDRGA